MAVGRALFAALAWLACMPLVAQQAEQPMHRRFDDAEKWSKVFDDPARDAWQKPSEVIAALKFAPDAVVADIGSGTGYFAVRLARALPRGRVYGADVEPEMVRFLNERAARENLGNLSSHAAGQDGPNLPAPVDLALVVDTYHHIPRRSRYFERLKSALRAGGRVAIIDFRLDSPTGPPPKHRIPPEQVKAEMERAGYRLQEEPGFLPHQYFLVFAPH
ncbi:MAG TPA: class I SAM-dependent methyltransferase [Burkholderiales bacterium]|jgi:SAM-dependent methyltransferase|nr:class I SAM-dependent methyltransferase [Burkholderiales bacterium]